MTGWPPSETVGVALNPDDASLDGLGEVNRTINRAVNHRERDNVMKLRQVLDIVS